MLFYGTHFQSLSPLFAGADARAGAAAGTVRFGYRDGKGILRQPCHGKAAHSFRRFGMFFLRHDGGADDRMGAYESAAVALDTVFRFPLWDFRRHVPPFVGGGAGGECAVYIRKESGYRKGISLLGVNGFLYVFHIGEDFGAVGKQLSVQGFVPGVFPALWHGNFPDIRDAAVYGVVIHLDDFFPLFPVTDFGGFFHQASCFFNGKDAGQTEKGRL